MSELFKEPNEVLDGLLRDLSARTGDMFELERVLDLDPEAVEVLVKDKASGNRFIGRIYHIDKPHWAQVKQAWNNHAKPLHKPPSFLPQPSYGLKVLGQCLAHIGAYLPGCDLATYLHYQGKCRIDFSVRLVANMLRYLEALEKLQIHHHRIRPSQIWMTKQGPAILRNNGLGPFERAIAEMDGLADSQDALYAAPEQLRGGGARGSATDIYLCGLILYEMIAGRPPFTGDFDTVVNGHLNQEMPNPATFNPDAGVGIARILAKALAKNPAHRFQNLGEFKSTLALLLPAGERVRLNSAQQKPRIGEQEKVKVHGQLAQAKAQCDQKQFPAALKTVEAVLMAVGPYEPAVKFYQQIWNAVHLAKVKTALQTAQQFMQRGQNVNALSSLHQALSLMPAQPQALDMQHRILSALPSKPAGLTRAMPGKGLLGKAAEFKSTGREDVAKILCTSVFLASSEQKDSFEHTMAQRELGLGPVAVGGISAAAAAMAPLDDEDDMEATVHAGSMDDLIPPVPGSPTVASVTPEPAAPEPAAPEPPQPEPIAETTSKPLTAADMAPLDDDEELDALPTVDGLDDDEMPALSGEFDDDDEELPAASFFDEEPPAAPSPSAPSTAATEESFFDEEPPPPAAPQPTAPEFAASQPVPPELVPSGAAAVQETPAPPTPVGAPAAPTTSAFDEDEDLLGLPDDRDVTPPMAGDAASSEGDSKQKKGKSPVLLAAVAAVAVLVLGGGAFFFMKYRATQAENAFQDEMARANSLESQGNLEGALAVWERLRTENPDRGEADAGYRTLDYKIQARRQELDESLQKAEQLFQDGVILDESGESALSYLAKAFRVEPGNPRGTALLEQIREQEKTRIDTLWEEKKYAEAKEGYDALAAMDANFRDEEFEAKVDQWAYDTIVQPGLNKLDRAIKRKRWDEAFDISEDLRSKMRDPFVVNERWDLLYEDYNTQLNDAETKGETEKMLNLLEVMVRIRPNETALADKRNRLNRDLNHAKIMQLEKDIDRAIRRQQFVLAGKMAFNLKNLDSENQIAENALGTVRTRFERDIEASKKTNPREAVKLYDQLIGVFNWKTYRQERSALATKIANFDKGYSNAMKVNTNNYEAARQAFDKFLSSNIAFASDQKYGQVKSLSESLENEKRQLQTMVAWEASEARNDEKTYVSILTQLRRQKDFRFGFAKSKHEQLIEKYVQLIENYSGQVILVIRGARNLPNQGTGFSRQPDTFAELKVSGQSFKTGVVDNSNNPQWDYTCNIEVQSGNPLEFTVYNQKRRGRTEAIGSLKIAKVPRSGRELELKSKSGWSLIIDVRRVR